MQEKKGYMWPDYATESNIKCSTTRIKSLKWVLENWGRKDTVVQAGGSYGVWPKILSKHFKTVYTFEPEQDAFRFLCINCPEKNIMKIQGAVGIGGKPVRLNAKGWSSHRVDSSGTGDVLYFSIDSLMIKKVDAILLDIEGHEYEALCGAENTIKYDKPIILVEGKAKDKHPKEVIERLRRVDEKILSFGYMKVADVGADKIFTHKGKL